MLASINNLCPEEVSSMFLDTAVDGSPPLQQRRTFEWCSFLWQNSRLSVSCPLLAAPENTCSHEDQPQQSLLLPLVSQQMFESAITPLAALNPTPTKPFIQDFVTSKYKILAFDTKDFRSLQLSLTAPHIIT
jgi:hypothetical protein